MTADFVLLTDTCADLPSEFVADAGIEVLRFPYVLDGEERFSHVGEDMSGFYRAMRDGSTPHTSSIPLGEYVECFASHAEAGEEVLFLAFSSGLSSSFESALMAREAVLADHPDAVIRIVDTLRASIAQGALVAEAVGRRDGGATAAEVEVWALSARERTVGYFTADTLEHLRRGGRVSDVTAAAGAMLDIKPMLSFSGDGGLKLERVVRGRRRSIRALFERAEKLGRDAGRLLVGHADCPDDAAVLEDQLREAYPGVSLMRCEIGPVIGSHTGPGMLAVAFVA